MMQTHTYVIEYGIYFTGGGYETHVVKVKNCMSDIHAKVKLEKYLQHRHNNFKSLVVYKCKDEYFDFGIFSDLLGKDNPFNF
jgi:hypothetical protein